MAIFMIFLLGIGNFALHKAVLESGHPLIGQMPFFHLLGGRLSLMTEFGMLLGTMLMAGVSIAWAWGYAAYSAANGLSAWLILTRKV